MVDSRRSDLSTPRSTECGCGIRRRNTMGSQEKFRLAQQFLERLRSGAAPDEIASLCTPDLEWDVPGDLGALPWIGHKTGREAVSHFVRDARMMVEGIGFDIRGGLHSAES